MEIGAIIGVILGGLVAGIIIGPLARLVIPGRQSIGVFTTILVGAVGAIVGGFIYVALGGDETAGIDWIRLGIQVGTAALLILLLAGRRGTE